MTTGADRSRRSRSTPISSGEMTASIGPHAPISAGMSLALVGCSVKPQVGSMPNSSSRPAGSGIRRRLSAPGRAIRQPPAHHGYPFADDKPAARVRHASFRSALEPACGKARPRHEPDRRQLSDGLRWPPSRFRKIRPVQMHQRVPTAFRQTLSHVRGTCDHRPFRNRSSASADGRSPS